MGEDPGTGRSQMTGTRDTEQIRRDIERSREELGDTVEALAAKTDVKAQAKQKLDAAKASVSDRTEQLADKAKDISPDSASAAGAEVTRKARDNPLPIAAVGAFAIGFLAGRLSKH